MLAVAAQFDLVFRLLTVVAAVFPVRPMGRHDALTDWMRTLRSDVGHRSTSVRALYASDAPTTSQNTSLVSGPCPGRRRDSDSDVRPGDASSWGPRQTLALVAQRVESWYRRAQSVVSRETVIIQPLRSDSTPNEIPRRLVFELRVGWEADPEKPDGPLVASVLRQPVGGRGQPSQSDENSGCMDPKAGVPRTPCDAPAGAAERIGVLRGRYRTGGPPCRVDDRLSRHCRLAAFRHLDRRLRERDAARTIARSCLGRRRHVRRASDR